MIIKPLADKVVLRIQKNSIKKVGEKEIHLVDTEDFKRLFVEAIGEKVERALTIGDEVIMAAATAATFHPDNKELIIVSEHDIWGVIQK